MSDTIQCTGNELNAVLERLRADEKQPWALDTGIGSNAGYSVEYFQSVVGRADLTSEVAGKSEQERQMEEAPPETVNPPNLTTAAPAPLCGFCGGSLSADGTCEICARLWAIREKAVQNRKLFKPKRTDHARLPHPND